MLEGFYTNNISNLRKLRIKREQEWQFVLEDSLMKLSQSKQHVLDLVETFFKEVEEKLIEQFLKPSQQCSLDRIDLPIKVNIFNQIRKWKRNLTN